MCSILVEQRISMEKLNGPCDTHLWAWTMWQALYISSYLPNKKPHVGKIQLSFIKDKI